MISSILGEVAAGAWHGAAKCYWRRCQIERRPASQAKPVWTTRRSRAVAGVHIATASTSENAETRPKPSSDRVSSCPSWARTRTLLIQSPPAWAEYSDNLLESATLPSIGARFPAVVCPVLPGETTGKLRRGRPSVVPHFAPNTICVGPHGSDLHPTDAGCRCRTLVGATSSSSTAPTGIRQRSADPLST
jgi:hypothetical protein